MVPAGNLKASSWGSSETISSPSIAAILLTKTSFSTPEGGLKATISPIRGLLPYVFGIHLINKRSDSLFAQALQK